MSVAKTRLCVTIKVCLKRHDVEERQFVLPLNPLSPVLADAISDPRDFNMLDSIHLSGSVSYEEGLSSKQFLSQPKSESQGVSVIANFDAGLCYPSCKGKQSTFNA